APRPAGARRRAAFPSARPPDASAASGASAEQPIPPAPRIQAVLRGHIVRPTNVQCPPAKRRKCRLKPAVQQDASAEQPVPPPPTPSHTEPPRNSEPGGTRNNPVRPTPPTSAALPRKAVDLAGR